MALPLLPISKLPPLAKFSEQDAPTFEVLPYYHHADVVYLLNVKSLLLGIKSSDKGFKRETITPISIYIDGVTIIS